MRTLFDNALERQAADGLNWTTAKHRAFTVGLATHLGPEDLSAVGDGSNFSWFGSGPYEAEFTSLEPHGFVVGDTVAHFGSYASSGDYPAWSASASVLVDEYRVPTTPDGNRYLCVKSGTAGTAEPAWDTVIGSYTISGGVIFQCLGDATESPMNGVFTVTSVPTTTTLRWEMPRQYTGVTQVAVVNLSKTYLDEVLHDFSNVSSSDPLTGKTVGKRGVLDADDCEVAMVTATAPQLMLICEVADAQADPDLLVSQQRPIMCYSIPTPNVEQAGDIIQFGVSNSPDRLLRL